MNDIKRIRTHIIFPPKLLEEIDTMCAQLELSRSELVRNAIKQYLQNQNNTKE